MITTGEGKFYSNGLDLDLLRNAPIDEVKTTLKGFSELLLRLLTLPFPTIAALNGTYCLIYGIKRFQKMSYTDADN